ncbi:MAG: hypothetical protein EOO38_26920 [Cytophagaceae bacterium]|nr:MAG: hypothetical protein EOO38_26920 [Cytophagaceae bacterium]
MQIIQRYMMTIHDVFTITDVGICGAETEVAIMDGGVEVDRVKFSGKCQSEGGYSRSYHGKPGLTAAIVKGPGRVALESVAA